MSDFDLDRLGDVWRQQPSAAELEALKRTAETVRRRARWAQLVDTISAVVIAGVVLVLVLANPKVDTLLVGGAAILIVLGGQVRQRRLRQEELKGLAGSVEEMLDQSIVRVGATLKRSHFSLYAFPPAFLMGLAVAAVVTRGADRPLLAEALSGTSLIVAPIVATALAAMAIHLVRAIRRGRAELERLTALRAAYSKERDSTAEE